MRDELWRAQELIVKDGVVDLGDKELVAALKGFKAQIQESGQQGQWNESSLPQRGPKLDIAGTWFEKELAELQERRSPAEQSLTYSLASLRRYKQRTKA